LQQTGHEQDQLERDVKGDMRRRKATLIARPHVAATTIDAHDGIGLPARKLWPWEVITDRYHVYWHAGRKPPRGHDGTVEAVAAGALPDAPVIISGGRDVTMRAW